MIKSARPRARSVHDFLDMSIGRSTPSGSCSGFIAYWKVTPELAANVRQEFRESRRMLVRLSVAARGTLAALLELWESARSSTAHREQDVDDFWLKASVKVHGSLVYNRILNPRQLHSALVELEQQGLVEPPDPYLDTERYTVNCPGLMNRTS
jgi:hypothetical protein